ncbi:hypothetical protein N7478_012710 [Penicillium angulare]|uniref:uncharacterized protein n=1 Tax=Penicillium angulare TaxID=116970 RepID=UPI0025408118|nr:uncharacterized protein N7478_012710 [Penicillium angulare]KAJ5256606.1 hypothetical protein N7478_012710 [Penicillium angulare]
MPQRSILEDNLPLAISQLRADNRAPVVSEQVEGRNNRVFKVDFPEARAGLYECQLKSELPNRKLSRFSLKRTLVY